MTRGNGGSPRVAGRYESYFAGQVCGEERFELLWAADGSVVATGEQLLEAPHPLAGQTRYRALVSSESRMLEVEIDWLVGTRALHAQHRAENGLWHVRIDYAGHVREQEGDYPVSCEVLFGSPLFQMFAMKHYVLAPGAEHEFAALLIGPPYMAVEPGKQQLRCMEVRDLETTFGVVSSRRVELHDPSGAEPPSVVWIDAHDRVLQSHEGLDAASPLVQRLVELVEV